MLIYLTATIAQNLSLVRDYIRSGQDLNAIDDSGRTALIIGIKYFLFSSYLKNQT